MVSSGMAAKQLMRCVCVCVLCLQCVCTRSPITPEYSNHTHTAHQQSCSARACQPAMIFLSYFADSQTTKRNNRPRPPTMTPPATHDIIPTACPLLARGGGPCQGERAGVWANAVHGAPAAHRADAVRPLPGVDPQDPQREFLGACACGAAGRGFVLLLLCCPRRRAASGRCFVLFSCLVGFVSFPRFHFSSFTHPQPTNQPTNQPTIANTAPTTTAINTGTIITKQ